MQNSAAAVRAWAIAAVVVLDVVLSGCVSTVAGTAVRGQNADSLDVPPLTETSLNEVLLSIGELNGIVGSTRMQVVDTVDEMTDHSESVSDPDCVGALYAAEEAV